MPSSNTGAPGLDRVLTVHPERARNSSGGSTAARSHRSPPSSAGSRSFRSGSGGSDSWTDLGGEDDIEPSDSASRSRPPSSRRRESGSRPAPKRRHSSRRSVLREEVEEEPEPRRHHSSRRHRSSRSGRHRHDGSRRLPSDESSSTVASHDDYPPYSHHGRSYRNAPPAPAPPQGHGGYPSSVTAAPGYAEAYAAHQALVHMPPPHDAFGYPQSNPFTPQSQQGNPFSPMGSTTASASYFASEPFAPQVPHHRPAPAPRPQSYIAPSSHYGSEIMSPYMPPAMMPYGPYGMMPGMPGYPPMPGWYSHLAGQPSPAPSAVREDRINEKKEELETLKALIQKHEEARVAREQAMIKKAEEEAAALAAAKARDEEEKKKTAEIAAASKKAKEDAEKKAEEAAKKATEEHQKKLKEAEAAKAEAEKKQKAVEEEVAKLKPPPDAGKQIKFKDAVGRKFSFPFQLCKTWKGMEGLIRQAFLHVDVIGDHVRAGHYDLTGPDGEIILPQVWDVCVQPEWEISMHMWPIEEKKDEKHGDMLVDPFAGLNFEHLLAGGAGPDPHKKPKKKGTSKKDKHPELVPPPPPPAGLHGPPPAFPPGFGGMLPDPLAGFFPAPPPGGASLSAAAAAAAEKKDKTKSKSSSSKKKEPTGLAAWFGGPAPRKKK